MAYTSYWQDVIDIVYDAINNELNTQEEIDAIIEDQFSILAGYTFDQDEVPAEYHGRAREFYSPLDILQYLMEGGIPNSSVWIWGEELDGDTIYHAYISDGS